MGHLAAHDSDFAKAQWCNGEINTCGILCSGSTGNNTCDPVSLSFSFPESHHDQLRLNGVTDSIPYRTLWLTAAPVHPTTPLPASSTTRRLCRPLSASKSTKTALLQGRTTPLLKSSAPSMNKATVAISIHPISLLPRQPRPAPALALQPLLRTPLQAAQHPQALQKQLALL